MNGLYEALFAQVVFFGCTLTMRDITLIFLTDLFFPLLYLILSGSVRFIIFLSDGLQLVIWSDCSLLATKNRLQAVKTQLLLNIKSDDVGLQLHSDLFSTVSKCEIMFSRL